ncbi:unnamed protein product [Phytophthora fragariaefolia]|uniref:Unnamed protein product n=1 Tax=Phytophthora fragariaefolia TaxID=1490495 RepID=A0A9W6X7A5_9STRA|nr:unnamed protein product [Phytophthora fragariaefolia]
MWRSGTDRNDDDRNDDGPGSDRFGADIWAHGQIKIDSAQSFRYTIRSRFIGYQHFGTSNDARNHSGRVVYGQRTSEQRIENFSLKDTSDFGIRGGNYIGPPTTDITVNRNLHGGTWKAWPASHFFSSQQLNSTVIGGGKQRKGEDKTTPKDNPGQERPPRSTSLEARSKGPTPREDFRACVNNPDLECRQHGPDLDPKVSLRAPRRA